MDFEDIVFTCPHCGSKHNVRDWLKSSLDDGMALLDDAYCIEVYTTLGTSGVRFIGLPCECGRDYALESYNGAVSILLDDEVVYGTIYRHDYPIRGNE